MNKLRITALIAAVLLLAACLAGCGEDKEDKDYT